MPKRQKKTATPTASNAPFFSTLPKPFQMGMMLFLSIYLLILPILYDPTVPEVAGDIRWYLNHFVGFLGLAALAFGAFLCPIKHLKIPLIVYVMMAFALMIPISLMDAYNPFRAVFFSVHWASYVALFFIFYAVRHAKFQKSLLWIFMLPFIANCLIGVLQYHVMTDAKMSEWIPFWPESGFVIDFVKNFFLQSAPPGTSFANKNLAASYSVLILPIAFFLFFKEKMKDLKCVMAVVLFLAMTFMIYSRSRASWIALFAALICAGIYIAFSPVWRNLILQNMRQPLTITLLIASVSGGFWAGNLQSPINKHGLNRGAGEQLKTLSRFDQREFGPRLAYNLNGTKIVQDHPFNGVGLGNFHTIYPNYHDARYPTPRHGYNVLARPQRAHNDVMQMFIETGIIGGLLFISLWFFAAVMTWKLGRTAVAEHHPALPLALFTGITGLCVNALADFPLQMPTAPALLFALLGLLTALYVNTFPKALRDVPFYDHLKTGHVKTIFGALAIVFTLSTILSFNYDRDRRTGAQYLKPAMQRMQASIIDAQTIAFLNKAYQYAPFNTRLLEYRAIAYHNYQGTPPIPAHMKRPATQEVLAVDPYAANNRINMTHDLIKQAENAKKLRDVKLFRKLMTEVDQEILKLRKLAPSSAFTYGAEGMRHYIAGDPEMALVAFKRAQSINPKFEMSKQAIPMLEKQLSATRQQ